MNVYMAWVALASERAAAGNLTTSMALDVDRRIGILKAAMGMVGLNITEEM
jgi:hypothetical protein